MKRKGKQFEIFWPELKDVQYPWPSNKKDFNELFLENMSDLEKYLLERVKGHMEKVGLKTSGSHPYLQIGKEGLIYHIDSGGKYFEIGDNISGNIFSTHNHSFKHDVVAFNTAADVLEYLDKEILAPKITFEKDELNLSYFLPERLNSVKLNKYKQNIENICSLQKTKFDILESPGVQEIIFPNGKATFTEGLCELRAESNFRNYSWVVARTLGILQRN